jgi:Ribose-5-phosphate isomerase
VRTAVSGPRLQHCLFEHGQNEEIISFVRQLTA